MIDRITQHELKPSVLGFYDVDIFVGIEACYEVYGRNVVEALKYEAIYSGIRWTII